MVSNSQNILPSQLMLRGVKERCSMPSSRIYPLSVLISRHPADGRHHRNHNTSCTLVRIYLLPRSSAHPWITAFSYTEYTNVSIEACAPYPTKSLLLVTDKSLYIAGPIAVMAFLRLG